MFTALSEQLTGVLNRLRGRGVLSESDVTDALREIRRHLLEADVSFEVTRGFVERVRERAVGTLQVKAVSPGQQVVKLVHDEIATLLGGTQAGLEFASVGPTVILLVGLQGSGKTTTAAKLARRLKLEQKAPALVAADIYRPAAAEQLRQLGQQVGVTVLPRAGSTEQDVAALVKGALREAESERARTVIVDTAGRLQIDAEMMDELKALKAAVGPKEVLLVADGMTGQDAVKIARGFHEGVGLTGVILTKLDGDARGGAALSIHVSRACRSNTSAWARRPTRWSCSIRFAWRGGSWDRAMWSPWSRRPSPTSMPKRRSASSKKSGPRKAWTCRIFSSR